MKWNKVSSYCIRSGAYRISKFNLGDVQLFQVYHGERLIGDARDGNAARKIAEKHEKTHKREESASLAIGGVK
ncbi:hypothetical protein DFO67_10428 [Modicisalibacter xianhensis]|uniref:Uncharacterized protein n=1 Tax=Modicisalibacter xianhensis TaxID=442341 RepID=A0A4R8G2U1_9GAMM|nr:hypothetical protein [Halomonas xianhensis]TDX30773.1 hypothetical protein DFO67_10428 [Halomonas xianhensis]